MTLLGQHNVTLLQSIPLKRVLLWSIDFPNLLTLTSTIVDNSNGKSVDVLNTTIGVRRAVFDNNRGLLLNDRPVKVKGMHI